MKKCLITISLILISFSIFAADQSENTKNEIIDRVAASVNGKAVTESEVLFRYDLMKKAKNLPKNFNKSWVLDQLINEQLIEQTAEEVAIQVTDARIDNEIADMMKEAKIADKNVFLKKIEQEKGITAEMLKLQIRQKFLSEQVMIYAVSFSSPSLKEIRDWYEKMKGRPEMIQMNLKHILIRPRSSSFADEKAASEKIKSIISRVQAKESFEEIARKESQDPGSAVKGGDLGWTFLAELDPYFASAALQGYRPGGISGVVKSSYGFHVIKFVGKKVASFEEMQPRIAGMLSYQKKSEQFVEWLEDKRSESELVIYMEGYVRQKGNNEKGSASSR